jgi:hypothetical protein
MGGSGGVTRGDGTTSQTRGARGVVRGGGTTRGGGTGGQEAAVASKRQRNNQLDMP